MPELPAMENFRLLIEETALGRPIKAVTLGKGKVVKAGQTELDDILLGRKLREARRYGKLVFVATDKGGWLSFHCGLTGYFEALGDGDDAPKAKLLLRFEDGGALAFFDPRMFGRVEIVASPEDAIAAHDLGPDAMAIARDDFIDAAAQSGQPLKGFFLDQSILAGIGNVYADEILFRARLDPKAKAKTLDRKTAAKLYKDMRDVLTMATERKASLDNWDMLPPSWLARHREIGIACPRCGTPIADYTVGGRHGYFCPHCQPVAAAA